jgi:hypothetical protein
MNRTIIRKPIKAAIFNMDNTLFGFIETKIITCAAVITSLDTVRIIQLIPMERLLIPDRKFHLSLIHLLSYH